MSTLKAGTPIVVKNAGAIFNGKTGRVNADMGNGIYNVTLDNGIEKTMSGEKLEAVNPLKVAEQIAAAKESGTGKKGGRKRKTKKRITRKKRSTRRR